MKFSTVNSCFITLMLCLSSSSALPSKVKDKYDDATLSMKKLRGASTGSHGSSGRHLGKQQSKKKKGDFVEYVIKEAEDILEYACDSAIAILSSSDKEEETFDPLVWMEICTTGNDLLESGARFETSLPSFLWANYRLMALGYPLIIAVGTVTEAYVPLFYRLIRLHRALGYGNTVRMLGFGGENIEEKYTDKITEDLYWSHFHILQVEDDHFPSVGPGIDRYCQCMDAEYEMLKQFGRDNYDAGELPNVLFDAPGIMHTVCLADSPGAYIARSDWHHHRAEFTGALMTGDEKAKAFVLHTLFHWESLFVMGVPDVGATLSYGMLDTSFQKLVDYVDANNGEW